MGNELYYTDQNGQKQDRGLHEEILNSGDEAAALDAGALSAWQDGLGEDLIVAIYGADRARRTKPTGGDNG